jgi:pimeloyl-ACP methyl ester carboxylesterase
MLSRAAILVRHNYVALLIDLRDHGESGGHFTGPGYVESRDIPGALKFLRSRGHVGPVAAMGHSYGAVAALYAAADSPDLAAVVADGAFISFVRHGQPSDNPTFTRSGTVVLGTLRASFGGFSQR